MHHGPCTLVCTMEPRAMSCTTTCRICRLNAGKFPRKWLTLDDDGHLAAPRRRLDRDPPAPAGQWVARW